MGAGHDGALGDTDLVLCERGLVVLRGDGDGYGGGFRLAVALELDGSIKGVRVLEHAETPGFGDILNPPSAWLDSFTTGDVHAVTGATITSDAVKAAVERAVQRARLEDMCVAWNESVAPQSRAGASHSLCAASASGPATPSLHGPSAAGRYAPFGICSMRGDGLVPSPRALRARIENAPHSGGNRPKLQPTRHGRPQGSPLRGERRQESAWNVPCCLEVGAAWPARPGERVGEFAQRILGATAKRSRVP